MVKKSYSLETFILLVFLIAAFVGFGLSMGVDNFLNTAIATGFDLLVNVALWIMAVAVLMSAVAAVLSEFGVFGLLNKILSPITKVIYGLPGVSALGAVSAYFSDNPAVISLAKEEEFKKQFHDYQIPVLCNVGTSFGMGLIVTISMIALGGKFETLNQTFTSPNGAPIGFLVATLLGVFAAILGSIVSVRLLLHFSRKAAGVSKNTIKKVEGDSLNRHCREGNAFNRLLESSLDGGSHGVQIGLQIIPGIVIIATIVLMLTFKTEEFTGAAYEGIGLIPTLGQYIDFIISPLFGLDDPQALAFPLTSLGSAGAAVGQVEPMLTKGIIGLREISVFTAMGITWSGFLSTHTSMMDSLSARNLTGKAIFSHTLGGLASGILANIIFRLVELIF